MLLVWSITPLYNMWLIALDSHEAICSGWLHPKSPTLEAFRIVVHQDFWYLERFWHQFGNSFIVGLSVMFLTLLIGSLASFTVGRLRHGWLLTKVVVRRSECVRCGRELLDAEVDQPIRPDALSRTAYDLCGEASAVV